MYTTLEIHNIHTVCLTWSNKLKKTQIRQLKLNNRFKVIRTGFHRGTHVLKAVRTHFPYSPIYLFYFDWIRKWMFFRYYFSRSSFRILMWLLSICPLNREISFQTFLRIRQLFDVFLVVLFLLSHTESRLI